MRRIGVITTSRADYGIYRPVLSRIRDDGDLRLLLFVTGAHLAPAFGLTVKEIEADGFDIAARVDILEDSDSPEAVARTMARCTLGFAEVYSRARPDILVVLGDRFEMHAAAVAAVPFGIPMAHIHGGEVTEGAFDESFRHSLTKLSHLHFVATEEYGRRVVQLGEEPWRVTVSGAPSLDNLRNVDLLAREDLERRFGLSLAERFLLVTFHPATLDAGDPGDQARTLLEAVEAIGLPAIITMPNADPGGRAIRTAVRARAAANPLLQPIENLGMDGYFSLMALASVMVGNSSSGIIEAASFRLPVVNVGNRQKGRLRPANVVDCGYDRDDIRKALSKALGSDFRRAIAKLENPYGRGEAAAIIVDRLKNADMDERLIAKRFHDPACRTDVGR